MLLKGLTPDMDVVEKDEHGLPCLQQVAEDLRDESRESGWSILRTKREDTVLVMHCVECCERARLRCQLQLVVTPLQVEGCEEP